MFSGVFFPPQLLPEMMQKISKILPATYGLAAIRGVLIDNHGLNDARGPIITLLTFLAVLPPISLWIFSRALRPPQRGRRLHPLLLPEPDSSRRFEFLNTGPFGTFLDYFHPHELHPRLGLTMRLTPHRPGGGGGGGGTSIRVGTPFTFSAL